jgi:hypothetical protein
MWWFMSGGGSCNRGGGRAGGCKDKGASLRGLEGGFGDARGSGVGQGQWAEKEQTRRVDQHQGRSSSRGNENGGVWGSAANKASRLSWL